MNFCNVCKCFHDFCFNTSIFVVPSSILFCFIFFLTHNFVFDLLIKHTKLHAFLCIMLPALSFMRCSSMSSFRNRNMFIQVTITELHLKEIEVSIFFFFFFTTSCDFYW